MTIYRDVSALPIGPQNWGVITAAVLIAEAIDGKRIAPVVEETVSDLLRKAGLLK